MKYPRAQLLNSTRYIVATQSTRLPQCPFAPMKRKAPETTRRTPAPLCSVASPKRDQVSESQRGPGFSPRSPRSWAAVLHRISAFPAGVCGLGTASPLSRGDTECGWSRWDSCYLATEELRNLAGHASPDREVLEEAFAQGRDHPPGEELTEANYSSKKQHN